MHTTDQQVVRLRTELARGRTLEQAAMRAGMHRNTAAKYASGALPSERTTARTWRTREDPFAKDWPDMEAMLKEEPGLEAKALFEHLQTLQPDRYQAGHLRTFQRRVKRWRATRGPEKEIFFPQAHRPGEAAQTDFTHAKELGITIRGNAYDHLLCVTVLPYSCWRWATPCRSESMAALREGVQNAVFQLGRVTAFHQTDNSTAATHQLKDSRPFNDEYLALMRHLGMKPRTIAVGKKEQNGSIESSNGALKRSLEQELLLRGSRDFRSHEAYAEWLATILAKKNRTRCERLAEEMAVMRPLGVRRLPAYTVVDVRVGSGSTIRVKSCTYSVPSRLIGEKVRVHIYDARLEVYLGGALQTETPRVRGRAASNVRWSDVIGWLVKKPGAFRRYRYRDAIFPTATYRRTWERLDEALSTWSADMNYLQILQLARDTGQESVGWVLATLLDAGDLPRFDRVVQALEREKPEAPELTVPEVEIAAYDDLTPTTREEVGR